MADTTRLAKRQAKIARTLIRLKHSLAADDEIEETLESLRQARIAGDQASMVVSIDGMLNGPLDES